MKGHLSIFQKQRESIIIDLHATRERSRSELQDPLMLDFGCWLLVGALLQVVMAGAVRLVVAD